MNKILLIISSVMCAAALSVTAYAETSIVYDMSTSSVVVSGQLTANAKNKEVSVNILYPGKDISDIEQGDVLGAVAFSTQRPAKDDLTFEISAEIDGDTGYYTVYYDYEGCAEPKSQTVYYVNKEDNKAALQALNDAEDADEVYIILKESSDDLCFDNEFDDKIDLKRVSKKIFTEIQNTSLDTEDYLSGAYIYNRACIFDALYQGLSVDFEKYSDDLNISGCASYDWYTEYKSSKFTSELNKRLKGKNIKSLDEFDEYFDEAVVNSVVFMPNGSGNVKKIMKDFKNQIGIESMTDSETVYKNLSGDIYYSYKELKSGYENELKKASDTNANNRPSGGGSGGSSGGGGGSVGGMKTDAVPTEGPTDISSLYPNVNYDGTSGNYADTEIVPWANEAIAELSARGVISGDENGNFNPEKFVTREEFAKILVLAFDMTDKGTAPEFTDVSESDWYYEYVKTAYSNSVVSGMGDSFGVGFNITRQDMAVMIANAMQLSGKNPTSGELGYNDNENIADYAKDAVSKIISAGIMKDIGNGYFNPNGLVTRAHAVKAVYLALK